MSNEKKILVVEDNDFVRMQIVRFLQEAGFAAEEATEGDTALDMVVENSDSFSAAVVDVRMEPVGGFEFVRALRSRNISLPVVFVTGDDTTDILEQSGKLGASAVLMKPVQKERLLQVVERMVKGKR